MTQLNTESDMRFDASITTEDRFAIRRWLQALVDGLNKSDLTLLEQSCAEELVVEGFNEAVFGKLEYLAYIRQIFSEKNKALIRYPEMAVSYNRYLFDARGTLELFVDGILSMEGTIEFKIQKVDDHFQFMLIKFYPRMMLALNQ